MAELNPIKHPVQLPESLINKWLEDTDTLLSVQFQEAAEWGAEAELNACCQWIDFHVAASISKKLKKARRPDIKTQVLEVLDRISENIAADDLDILRHALKC